MVTKKGLYILGVTAIAICFLPGYIKLIKLKARNSELQVKVEELKYKNAQYLNQIHKLQTDPLYVEKVAREKMGVVRKGEVLYKVVPEDDKANGVK